MSQLIIHHHELTFGRKRLLPIDNDMEKRDVGVLPARCMNNAQDYSISEAREAYQKVLEAARANITKAQKLHYDKRHFKQVKYN